MTKLQQQLIIMMNDFKIRADKIGLKYSLYAGTALGAVRHGGFIPWDDDADFAIDLHNRKKLIKNFDEHFSDKFNLITEYRDGLCLFMKLHHKTLRVKSDSMHSKDTKYLWLDFFTIGQTKQNKVPLLYKIAANIKYATNFKSDKRKEPLVNFFRRILKLFFPKIIVNRVMFHYLKKTKGDFMYSDFVWRLNTFTNASFEDMDKIQFEGIEFPIFQNYEKHLSSYFGSDFMSLPKEEDRITHGIELDD